ncbi:hypothetical protein FKM82_010725 [Ascaphus truei]
MASLWPHGTANSLECGGLGFSGRKRHTTPMEQQLSSQLLLGPPAGPRYSKHKCEVRRMNPAVSGALQHTYDYLLILCNF